MLPRTYTLTQTHTQTDTITHTSCFEICFGFLFNIFSYVHILTSGFADDDLTAAVLLSTSHGVNTVFWRQRLLARRVTAHVTTLTRATRAQLGVCPVGSIGIGGIFVLTTFSCTWTTTPVYNLEIV